MDEEEAFFALTELAEKFGVTNNLKHKGYINPHYSFKKIVPLIRYDEDHTENIRIVFNARDTAIIFNLMASYPDIEWGLYTVHKKLNDINVEKKNTIDIEELILVPQKTDRVSVEYMEVEFPELSQEVFKKRFTHNVGRIHSHHSMEAYHSATDEDQLIQALTDEQTFISTVLSLKHRVKSSTFDDVYRHIRQETLLCVPKSDDTCVYGVGYHATIVFTPYGEDEHLNAHDFVNDYENMINIVKEKSPIMEYMKSFIEENDDFDGKAIRKLILEDDSVAEFITKLTEKHKASFVKENKDVLEGVIDVLNSVIKELD